MPGASKDYKDKRRKKDERDKERARDGNGPPTSKKKKIVKVPPEKQGLFAQVKLAKRLALEAVSL